jgi:hypothetical protein
MIFNLFQVPFVHNGKYIRHAKEDTMRAGIEMASILMKQFHPFALLITLGIFFLIILNLNSNVPFSEKIGFLAIAGAFYITVIMFESWRMNQK